MLILFVFVAFGCSRLSTTQISDELPSSVDKPPVDDPTVEDANQSTDDDDAAGGSNDDVGDDGDDDSDGDDQTPASRFVIIEANPVAAGASSVDALASLEGVEEGTRVIDLMVVTQAVAGDSYGLAIVEDAQEARVELILEKSSGEISWKSEVVSDVSWEFMVSYHESVYFVGFSEALSKLVIRRYRLQEDFFNQVYDEKLYDEVLPDYVVLDAYDKKPFLYLYRQNEPTLRVELEKNKDAEVVVDDPQYDSDLDHTVRMGGLHFDRADDFRVEISRVSDDSTLGEFETALNSFGVNVSRLGGDKAESGFRLMFADPQGRLAWIRVDSPRMIDAKKYYSYDKKTVWFHASNSVTGDLDFEIPSEISVSEGNSGNHALSLFIDGVQCQYKGGSDQSKPKRTNLGQWKKGMVYKFKQCSNGWSENENVTASESIRVEIHNGNSRSSPTRVDAFLD